MPPSMHDIYPCSSDKRSMGSCFRCRRKFRVRAVAKFHVEAAHRGAYLVKYEVGCASCCNLLSHSYSSLLSATPHLPISDAMTGSRRWHGQIGRTRLKHGNLDRLRQQRVMSSEFPQPRSRKGNGPCGSDIGLCETVSPVSVEFQGLLVFLKPVAEIKVVQPATVSALSQGYCFHEKAKESWRKRPMALGRAFV